MNVYPISIEYNGERVQLDLKLDVKNIRALQEKCGEDILGIISDAPANPGKLADLIGAALRWKGNQNKLHDGDEVFDAMVAGGEYCGPVDWTRVIGGIASVSGLMQPDFSAAMTARVERQMMRSLDQMGADVEKDKESADPSRTAG